MSADALLVVEDDVKDVNMSCRVDEPVMSQPVLWAIHINKIMQERILVGDHFLIKEITGARVYKHSFEKMLRPEFLILSTLA